MNITVIDNYDSFTYNLVQYLQQLGAVVTVHRNDAVTVQAVLAEQPNGIVVSPGPGTVTVPKDVGVCPQLVTAVAGQVPLLGVCLGHQLLGHMYGGEIVQVPPMHGKRDLIEVETDSVLFRGLESSLEVMRYHSLAVSAESWPDALRVTARSRDGVVMACENIDQKQWGVQFHPESIGTPTGMTMLENFLAQCAA